MTAYHHALILTLEYVALVSHLQCCNACAFMLCFTFSIADGQCSYGDIRLANGYIEQEGRVEICVDDVWGVICDDGWDKTDAHIACQQLGYAEQGMLQL